MSKKHMTRNDLGSEVYILSDKQLDQVKKYHAPLGYNAGTYGWNYDVYLVNGKTFVSGYRNFLKSWERLSDKELMKMMGF